VGEHREYTTNEEADATARVFGVLALCIGLGIAYLVWPAGASEITLGAMSLAVLFRIVAAVVIGLGSVAALVLFWW
jgi:hypothetical protein